MDSYIITLHSSAISEEVRNEPDYESRQKLMEAEARSVVQQIGLSGNIVRVYGGAFFGFVIQTSNEEIKILTKDPRVKHIEKDQGISLSPPEV